MSSILTSTLIVKAKHPRGIITRVRPLKKPAKPINDRARNEFFFAKIGVVRAIDNYGR